MLRYIMIVGIAVFFTASVLGAVGCDLNEPDRDVKRFFPASTSFKTMYVSIAQKGGVKLQQEIERKLGDTFKGLYETADTPYTMYEIFSGKDKIGYIHGVNQKGKYGGIQVFLALDLSGTIKAVYFQKISSKNAKDFRADTFTKQFIGLNVKDFLDYDVSAMTLKGKLQSIKNTVPTENNDFHAIMRGMKKNLILVDEFLLQNVHFR